MTIDAATSAIDQLVAGQRTVQVMMVSTSGVHSSAIFGATSSAFGNGFG